MSPKKTPRGGRYTKRVRSDGSQETGRRGCAMAPVAVTLAILLALVLLLAGCDPEPNRGGPPQPPPTAGKPQQPKPADPEVNQPGPQKDPGQCVDRPVRSALIDTAWHSETDKTPLIAWSHNGAVTTATNLRSDRMPSAKGYAGEWSVLVTVKCGDTLAVRMSGTSSMFFALCSIVDLGDGPVKTGQRNCEAAYNVP